MGSRYSEREKRKETEKEKEQETINMMKAEEKNHEDPSHEIEMADRDGSQS